MKPDSNPDSLAKIDISPRGPYWAKGSLSTPIGEVRELLNTILSAETAISDKVTSPRSFGLVDNHTMLGWRGLIEMCNDDDTVGDLVRCLNPGSQLRPFVEFILLKIMLARSGMTFKKVSKKIVKDGNGGLLAERYLLWALNHLEKNDLPIKVAAHFGPHELEPKYNSSHRGLGCDAFMNVRLQNPEGPERINFGVQFGVTLDEDVEKGKIADIMAGHAELKQGADSRILYKKGQPKYLDRYMPDGFILFHTDNTLSAFTDESRSVETIQKHEDWFKRGTRSGSPIDNLPDDTREELTMIQDSFSGALLAWDEFRKNNEKNKGPIKTEKMDMKIGKYHYLVYVDPRMKRAKGSPVRVEVRSSTKHITKKSVLYSLSVFL